MERTLSIIKPDGVKKGLIGEIIKRFDRNGFKLRAMKMLHISKKDAERFYAIHKGKAFFESLTTFMSSDPIVVMVLESENAILKNREIMGATDPAKADAGTIRRDFADNVEQNIVHGSDGPETARTEIAFFFNELEINEY
ncbi:MAG: nucleoside-diphosphate kinase [Pseudomonadota bacterium]